MWFLIIIVIAIAGYGIYKYLQPATSKQISYTKEKLQQMSLDELHTIHNAVASIIYSEYYPPNFKRIPANINSFGCKTYGDAKALLNLIMEVEKTRDPKKHSNNAILKIFTETEKQKLIKSGNFDYIATACDKAFNGNAECMLFLGFVFNMELNEPKKSFYWMEQSAKRGNAKAEHFLSIYYGDGYGVPKDKDKSTQHLIAAAKRGHKASIDCCKYDLNMTIEEMRSIGIPV